MSAENPSFDCEVPRSAWDDMCLSLGWSLESCARSTHFKKYVLSAVKFLGTLSGLAQRSQRTPRIFKTAPVVSVVDLVSGNKTEHRVAERSMSARESKLRL